MKAQVHAREFTVASGAWVSRRGFCDKLIAVIPLTTNYIRYSEVDVKIKNASSRLLALAAILLLSSAVCFADTIKLKNGSVIKGKVVTYNQQEFTVVLDLGTSSRRSASRMVIAVEDVESIEFDSQETSAPSSGTENAEKRSETSRGKQPPSRNPERDAIKDPPPATTTDSVPTTPVSTKESALISEKTVSVTSSADWTSTEIRVQRGQRIIITAEGEVDLGNNQRSGPAGIALSDSKKLMGSRLTGALIAVVGDDNDDFIFIGRAAEFTATHNGILFLSVNEGNLKDNSGSFLARVKVMSGK